MKATSQAFEYLRRAQKSGPGAAAEKNARVRYLYNLIVARPLHYAERLVEADPSVDTSPALTHLWEQNLRLGDSGLAEFLVRQLANSPEGSQTRKRIADSIVGAPDFQTRLVPALVQTAQSIGDLSEQQIAGVKKLVESLKPNPVGVTQPADVLRSLGLPNAAFNLRSAYGTRLDWTPPQQRNWEDLDWRGILVLIAGFGLFLCGVFLYNGDLPPDVSIGQRLLRRVLSLAGDASIIAFFSNVHMNTNLTSSSDTDREWGATWMQVWMFGAFAAFAALHEYFAPLTFTAQSILFFFNMPLVAVCVFMSAKY